MNYIEIITNIIKNCSSDIEFDFNTINNILINIHSTTNYYYGKVVPLFNNDGLQFELLLHHNIINDLISDDKDNVQHSHSVIYHELYHCKEIAITSQYINCGKAYLDETMSTTKMLLFSTAVKQWSEYYAYYNSSQIRGRDIKLSNYICAAEAAVNVLHSKLLEVSDIQMPLFFINDIVKFIQICVMLSAHYNSTHEKRYKNEVDYLKRSSIYNKYYPYLIDLVYVMQELYTAYPNWVSEKTFMELGYKLFSFIKINGITYSTDDLSDNFIFVKGN